jgi:hypothetical protein
MIMMVALITKLTQYKCLTAALSGKRKKDKGFT